MRLKKYVKYWGIASIIMILSLVPSLEVQAIKVIIDGVEHEVIFTPIPESSMTRSDGSVVYGVISSTSESHNKIFDKNTPRECQMAIEAASLASIIGLDMSGTYTYEEITSNLGINQKKQCEHEYSSEITKEVTCSQEGETTYTCSLCGNTYVENIPIDSEIHRYHVNTVIEASCLDEEITEYKCVFCEKTYSETTSPANGHDYTKEIIANAECNQVGTSKFVCKICNDSYLEEIAALGHEKGKWNINKKPSLFGKGLEERKCIRCNEILEKREMPSVITNFFRGLFK